MAGVEQAVDPETSLKSPKWRRVSLALLVSLLDRVAGPDGVPHSGFPGAAVARLVATAPNSVPWETPGQPGDGQSCRYAFVSSQWSPPAPPGHSDLDTSNTAMFSEQAAQRAHTLLSPPAVTSATFARVPVAMYTNTSQPFRLGERSFSRQYAHIYATRLVQMRPFLVSQAQRHWGK